MSYETMSSDLQVVTWQELGEDGLKQIHDIEKQTWASWLAAGYESLAGRAEVYPDGQIAIVDVSGEVCASLSTNKINWGGDAELLPSWDQVAGEPTDYSQTYQADGNTSVLMSMNVKPSKQGLHLPSMLVKHVQNLAAQTIGVDWVIGSFRPSEFSTAVLANPELTFQEYVAMTREDGYAYDKWLRVLGRMGMQQLIVDKNAMTVCLESAEFHALKDSAEQTGGHEWKQVKSVGPCPVYWCGETGLFTGLRNGLYVYNEENVWGLLWSREATV